MCDERKGSSEKYSKLRPPSGERLMLTPGPRTTLTDLARASAPIATPTRWMRSRSQLLANADAVGKQVANTLWSRLTSVLLACLRTPCGPSVSMIAGNPSSGTACISQKFWPETRAIFWARVNAASRASGAVGFVCVIGCPPQYDIWC